MTSQVNGVLGLLVATASVQAVKDPVDAVAAVSGVALMIWLTARKSRECEKLREENHQLREEHHALREELQGLSRELGKRCSDCTLVRAANSEFIENRAEHHEKQN